MIVATGTRDPAFGVAQTSWKLGIVLLTSIKDTPADVAAATEIFDPIAAGFAPAFNAATSGRGTLEIVTHGADPGAGGGGGAGGSGGAGGAAGTSTSTSATTATTGAGGDGSSGDIMNSGCTCRIGSDEGGGGEAGAAGPGLLAALALSARRRRSRAYPPRGAAW